MHFLFKLIKRLNFSWKRIIWTLNIFYTLPFESKYICILAKSRLHLLRWPFEEIGSGLWDEEETHWCLSSTFPLSSCNGLRREHRESKESPGRSPFRNLGKFCTWTFLFRHLVVITPFFQWKYINTSLIHFALGSVFSLKLGT